MSEISATRTPSGFTGQVVRAESRRLLRFLAVGGCCFLIETAALSVFALWFGMDRIVAKGLAFVIALCASFLGNYFWTYHDSRAKSLRRQIMAFAAVSIGGLAVNLLVFSAIDWYVRGLLSSTTSLYVAHVGAVGAALAWNFIVNRLVTFSDVRIGQ